MRRASAVFVCGFGLCAVAVAQDAPPPSRSGVPAYENSIVRFSAEYWRPTLGADLQIGQFGTLLDVKQDLGVADTGTYRLSGTVRVGDRARIRASYTPLDYVGDNRLTRTIVFQGKTYEVSTQVSSALKGGYYTGTFEFGLARSAGFDLAGLVGVKYFDVDALIVAPSEGKRALESLKAPIPVAGAVARVYAGRVGFTGEFSGLTIGKRGSLYELDVAGRVFAARNVEGHVGYRRLSVRAEDEPDFGRVRPGGIYFGVEVGF